jgi:hypothetical protein
MIFNAAVEEKLILKGMEKSNYDADLDNPCYMFTLLAV